MSYCPLTSVMAVVWQIFPPASMTRFCQSAFEGLWSFVIWQHFEPPSLTRTALESPRLATQQIFSQMKMAKAQVPELSPFFLHSCSAVMNAFLKALGTSFLQSRAKKYSWRCSFMNCEHAVPPWPSQIENHLQSSSRQMVSLSSFVFRQRPSWVMVEQLYRWGPSSPEIPLGNSGICLVGFLAGCFALQAWLAYWSVGPVKALAIRNVVTPLYEVVVVDNTSQNGPHGVPGSMNGIFLSTLCTYCGPQYWGSWSLDFILYGKGYYFFMWPDFAMLSSQGSKGFMWGWFWPGQPVWFSGWKPRI